MYFPVVNPSGFQISRRETNPTRKDPNRDFPIDSNVDCYTTNAALILDHLFRKFSFDLTIVLHDGGEQIGFNWGTMKEKEQSHTEDYNIQLDIAAMMQRVGG